MDAYLLAKPRTTSCHIFSLTLREGDKTGTGMRYLKQKEGFHTWASIPAFRVEKEGLGACLARGDHALEGDTGEMSLL